MDPESQIADEIYENLRAHLLHSGRGRPKSLLQDIPITNKLLIQLSFLQKEGKKPVSVFETWLSKILDVQNMAGTKSRYTDLVLATRKQFDLLPDGEKDGFLCLGLDLAFISESLSAVGITRDTILHPPSALLLTPITNRVVIDITKFAHTQAIPKKVAMDWLFKLTGANPDKLPYCVKALNKRYNKLLRNVHRDRQAVESFLDEQFIVAKGLLCQPTSDAAQVPCQSTLTVAPPTPQATSTPSSTLGHSCKNKCMNCCILKEEKNGLLSAVHSLQTEKKEMSKTVETTLNELQQLKQSFKVKEERLKRRTETSKTKSKKTLQIMRDEIRSLKNEQEKVNLKLKDRQKCVKKCMKENESLRKDIASEIKNVMEKDIKNDDVMVCVNSVNKEHKNAYSDTMRKTVIQLQCEAGVSAANTQKVIQCVSKNLFNYTFDKLPCQTSALNMCSEAYAISQVQAAEALLESENVTIHSDGTSRDTKKIVSEQLSTDKGKTIYLGYTPVAVEDATTLLDVTINSLRRIADSSCDVFSLSSDELLSRISSKITSTMSDRASVMKLWGKKLEEHFSSELGGHIKLKLLHCNAHFLLGLSNKCEAVLLKLEQDIVAENDSLLGRDTCDKFSSFKSASESATARAIRTTCDVLGPRGDQKNGRHLDWITHCPESILPSFKSNRFNAFFEAAAAIIFHKQKIHTFFSSGILDENLNLKLQSVQMDVQDENLMTLLTVLALFYLKITGPYWVLINSSIIYADFHLYVKDMLAAFQHLTENPNWLLDPSLKSVFGERLVVSSPTRNDVHSFAESCDKSLIEKAICTLAKECISVIQNQLADFLPGGTFSDVDESVRNAIFHCPITNLIGEGSFGDFDFDMCRRRNASLHSRSSNHIVKRNKTMSYLTKKSKCDQEKIFCHARKMGKKLRQQNRTLEEKVKIDVKQRFADNQQKKINKMQAALSRHSKAVNSVKDHGGPCKCPEDVDDLVERLQDQRNSDRQVLEVLKSEIRYQKEVFGQKLKFGNKSFMITSLKNCLSPLEPPSAKKRKVTK